MRAGIRALRAVSFTAAVIPVALGAVLAIGSSDSRWELLPLTFLAAILLQAGTNVINDVFDFRRGVDSRETLGDSGVFVNGWISSRGGYLYGVALFAAGSAVGLVLTLLTGWPLLIFGVVGVLGGYFYTGGPKGWKYLALGDIGVFLLMGPLMVMGSFYVITGEAWDGRVILASLPVGFMVAAILEANNLRDLETDAKAGVQTISRLLGFTGARWEFALSVAAAYVIVAALAAAGTLTLWSLLVLITLPISVPLVRLVLSAPRPGSRRLAVAMPKTALLHMAFGVTLVVGVGLGAAL